MYWILGDIGNITDDAGRICPEGRRKSMKTENKRLTPIFNTRLNFDPDSCAPAHTRVCSTFTGSRKCVLQRLNVCFILLFTSFFRILNLVISAPFLAE